MLLVVGESRQTVLAPVIGAGAGLVMAEVVPGISILAVVLPHGPPLPLAQVGAPLPPGDFTLARIRQALLLRPGSFDCVCLCLHLVSPYLFLCLSDTRPARRHLTELRSPAVREAPAGSSARSSSPFPCNQTQSIQNEDSINVTRIAASPKTIALC